MRRRIGDDLLQILPRGPQGGIGGIVDEIEPLPTLADRERIRHVSRFVREIILQRCVIRGSRLGQLPGLLVGLAQDRAQPP